MRVLNPVLERMSIFGQDRLYKDGFADFGACGTIPYASSESGWVFLLAQFC
jgi:hypothetical protein